jgi:signal transduction histidine kinase
MFFTDSEVEIFKTIFNKNHPDISLYDEIRITSELLFDPGSKYYHNDDMIAEHLDKMNNEQGEYFYQTKKGRFEFGIKFSKLCLQGDSNSLMIVVNDISEKMRHRDTIISEKMKTIMINSISHELRSPLNQINGTLSLLSPTLVSPEQIKYISIANSACELLTLKIDDLMTFYDIETNTFKTVNSKFNIRNNCLMLESLFKPTINNKSVKLRFFVEESTPEYVYLDSDRVKGIICTFIGNAIKYTKKGVISVIINWIPINNKNLNSVDKLKIAVSDSGYGISDANKQKLFKFLDPSLCENYLNGKDDSSSPPLAGTGLGIAQKISHQLGTKIELNTVEGCGSSFWIELNINKASKDKDSFIKKPNPDPSELQIYKRGSYFKQITWNVPNSARGPTDSEEMLLNDELKE